MSTGLTKQSYRVTTLLLHLALNPWQCARNPLHKRIAKATPVIGFALQCRPSKQRPTTGGHAGSPAEPYLLPISAVHMIVAFVSCGSLPPSNNT